MDYILELIKIIPALLKQNSSMLINLAMFVSFLAFNNMSAINEYFTEEDIATESIHKAFKVETELETLKKEYGADAVCVSILHNGTTASADPSFHLMKFTVLYSVGESSRIAKILYRDRPLNLWISQFRQMIMSGSYMMKNMDLSKDPLVRRIGENMGTKTQICLPLYSKEHYLLGFCTLSYKHQKNLSEEAIISMKRSLLVVESLL